MDFRQPQGLWFSEENKMSNCYYGNGCASPSRDVFYVLDVPLSGPKKRLWDGSTGGDALQAEGPRLRGFSSDPCKGEGEQDCAESYSDHMHTVEPAPAPTLCTYIAHTILKLNRLKKKQNKTRTIARGWGGGWGWEVRTADTSGLTVAITA